MDRAEFPALPTCPGHQWLGPLSVDGSDEQIFGVNEQISGRDQRELTGVMRPGGIGIFWTRAPVVAPLPTDAKVIAGTILGIAGMAINASMYMRYW